MDDYINFEEKFKKLIEKHKEDKDSELIKDYPIIFSTIMGIASDRNSDGITKMITNSAISYFVIPADVLPESEMGITGYMDDFFVCICALRELLNYDKTLGEHLIKKYWNLEKNYENYIPDKYYELIRRLDQKIVSDIMSYSGLGFTAELIGLKNNPSKYSEHKIIDLQRKLHYLFFMFFKRPLIGKDEKIKFETQFFGTDEFIDFSKKIELLSNSHEDFKTAKNNIDTIFDMDEELKKIKMKRLLR